MHVRARVDPHVARRRAGVGEQEGLAEGAGLEEQPRAAGAGHGADAHGEAAVDGGRDGGVLRVPAEPHDARVLRLGNDVHGLAGDVGQEGVVGGVGRGHDGGIIDPQDGLVGVAPHGAGFGVVAQSGPPLPVDEAGAEVDVPDADLAGLIRPLLVRGDALREVGVGTRVSNRRGGAHDDEESRHDDSKHRHAETRGARRGAGRPPASPGGGAWPGFEL